MGSLVLTDDMKTSVLLLLSSCLLVISRAQRFRPFAGGNKPKLCSDGTNPRCGDGSLPVCRDGQEVSSTAFPPCSRGQGPPRCNDGGGLKCGDGSEFKSPKVCNDGSRPSCQPGGVPPVCPDNSALDFSSFPPCPGSGRPRERIPRCTDGGRLECADGTPLPILDRVRNFLQG